MWFILMTLGMVLAITGVVMLVVQAIRRKGKKLSLIILVLGIVFFAVGMALPTEDSASENDVAALTEESVEKNAESYIIAHCILAYECKTVRVNTTTVEIDDNSAVAKGKVTVIDDYGDQYTARFDYTVKYSPESGFYGSSLDMETPTR